MPDPSLKPHVFIGSSSEGLEIAHTLQFALQGSFDVTTWDQGSFELTRGTLESLTDFYRLFDFAIVVITPDCVATERGVTYKTPRDNVVFEAGFFIGVLGRDRTFIVQCDEDDVRLPTDLQGSTIAKFRRSGSASLGAALNQAVVPISNAIRQLGVREKAGSGPRTFPRSDSGEFTAHMEALLPRTRRVVLIGIGLNILHRDPVRHDLMTRASSGQCTLEIYLADPASPAVEHRLIEEELGPARPSVGRPGLRSRLESLLEERRRLGAPDSIQIKLLRHYPTFALLIADSEYFIYPYGYATIGNFSPVIRLSATNPSDAGIIRFLDRHYEMVKEAAVDAGHAFRLRSRPSSVGVPLHAFAVYYIPPEDSALYRFGSEVVGYDVRAERPADSPWPRESETAGSYGLHLTCCDVLFFLNRRDVDLVVEQVAFLAKDFPPFELAGLEIRPMFPDPRSIAIGLEDPTGSLEALHFELVHRVYRRADASSYSLREVGFTRDADQRRAEMMTRRYKAPYILQRYRPHLTLLSDVPPERHDEIIDRLRGEFEARVHERTLTVGRLAIMERPEPSGRWRIAQEIDLR
jgi:hypothetical protein